MFEPQSGIGNVQGEPGVVFFLFVSCVPENKADGDTLKDTGAGL